MLEKAIEIAVTAHKGQIEKAGKPYILHCLRVMLKGKNEDEQIVGVLHDVVEDSSVTLADLKKAGFNNIILKAVDCLTKPDKCNYDDYIKKVISNKLARNVKLYDLEDNMNILRLRKISANDLKRLNKYLMVYSKLKSIEQYSL